MQYPVEIPGITNWRLLKESFDELCRHQGSSIINDEDFRSLVHEKAKILNMNPQFLKRGVNEGFSGGEKKKNEILQMLVLSPRLALLDETDSGLDIDALKVVANGINKFRSPHHSVLLVTHYQRLLNYIVPDYVHILQDGKIIKTGNQDLAVELEGQGYEGVLA